MNPERNPAPPEQNLELVLAMLQTGNQAALRSYHGIDELIQAHSSDPSVRAAAVQGMIASIGLHTETAMAEIRDALGLTDAELRSPEARRTARKHVGDAIRRGDFGKVAQIEAVVSLGPDYFSDPEILNRIETGVEQAEFSFYRPTGTFSNLAKLPIPTEFYQRPPVVAAAIKVQQRAVHEGLPDAIAVMRHVGMDAFPMERLRISARSGIGRVLRGGNYRTYREYAEAFGFQDEEIDWSVVRGGYLNLIALGRIDAATDFAEHFPQLPETEKTGPDLQRSVTAGIYTLLLAGNFSEAERLSQFADIPRDVFLKTIRPAVEILIRQGDKAGLEKIRDRWNVPPSLFHDAAAAAIKQELANETLAGITANWNAALRVVEVAGLSREQFEKAATQGQIDRMNRMGYGIETLSHENWRNRIREIHALRTALPIDSNFAERLERDVAFEFAKKILKSNVPGRVAEAMKEFRFLDAATVRRAAIEAAKEALQTDSVTTTMSIQVIQSSLRNIRAERLTYDDVAETAEAWVFSSGRYLDPDAFTDLFDDPAALPASGDDRLRMLDSMREKVRSNMLFAENDYAEARPRLFALYGLDWETFPLKDIPLKLLLNPDEDGLRERAKSDPWAKSLAALAKLQGRSANEEHDPWERELFPLVNRATREDSLLDRESQKDGALLVEYVKTFGMMNLPNISRIFFGLKRGPFASLPDAGRAQLIELVGPKAARMESENLINELRMLKLALQRDLLADVVPRKAMTALGEEVFLVIRGSTEWEHGDRPSEVFAAWKETVERETAEIVRLEREALEAIEVRDEAEAARLYAVAGEKRELVAVAPGYEEARFAVHKVFRGKETKADAEIDAMDADQEIQDALTRYLRMVIPFLGDELDQADDALARLVGLRVPIGSADRSSVPSLDSIERLFAQDDAEFVAFMETVASEADDAYLLALSATHMSLVIPGNLFDSLERTSFGNTEEEVRHRVDFMTQYLREHYLNPTQDSNHTGHSPFSETLRLALERAWQAGGDATTNVLLRADATIDAVRARQTVVSTETVDVALVPVQGPLRIYAGDIGDACYAKQHGALARGEYPRLKAMVFVTNRGNSRERLNGSVLFVETNLEETNERVLVIRANNPRQNLVAQLNAPSLVRQTIDAAIATARRRKIKHVGVVRDEATQASSNREAVSEFYADEYQHNATARLISEPETNFNGYDVWDDTGDHPSVIVWTNDDPEAT